MSFDNSLILQEKRIEIGIAMPKTDCGPINFCIYQNYSHLYGHVVSSNAIIECEFPSILYR